MNVLIKRFSHEDKQTLGYGIVFNENNGVKFTFSTLELPWLENERRISCIPIGEYTVVKRESPKFGLCFWVKDVPNRDWILIHQGNYHTQILGCILVGEKHLDINGDGYRDVVSSKKTLKNMLNALPNEFKMVIENQY